MSAVAFKDACHSFVQAAAPYLPIKDDTHYEEALELILSLLEEAEDSPDDPINAVIDLLSRAIETYENRNEGLTGFEKRAMEQPADLAMLRLLMAQHRLSMADLPEIGSKSMVSRVLSGERSLSKSHIRALSQRFRIDPGLFF
ncbi:helix-turn-helix domain-containing protein [Pistricoccus aurantiacus]|uniref:helix-turn-helix domain-containing protein n=1 Tax=Pistricoccus aurantiacus TaxID=1883414 RepID=UPI0036388029